MIGGKQLTSVWPWSGPGGSKRRAALLPPNAHDDSTHVPELSQRPSEITGRGHGGVEPAVSLSRPTGRPGNGHETPASPSSTRPLPTARWCRAQILPLGALLLFKVAPRPCARPTVALSREWLKSIKSIRASHIPDACKRRP